MKPFETTQRVKIRLSPYSTLKGGTDSVFFFGSLSTVVGDEKLTSREDRIGPLFMYVQCDEDTFLKVDEVSKT
ncbi:hypothetical protein J7T88_01135, partial [Streptococcus thermophilus]|uniref:hypothetical protein n=1 Tax=Streptococcus thermophilus TaxID=1308 RepID=UPI0035CF89A2